jgi:hypothetical protein
MDGRSGSVAPRPVPFALLTSFPLHNIGPSLQPNKGKMQFQMFFVSIKEASPPPTCCLLVTKFFSWLN